MDNEKHRGDLTLLKAGQVAQLLGLSTRKIWSMASQGDLPRVKFGSATRFRVADVDALIQQGREAATA